MTYQTIENVTVGVEWSAEDEQYEVYIGTKFIGTATTIGKVRKLASDYIEKNGMAKRLKIRLEDDAFEPVRAHETDAGLDLRSRDEDFWLWAGHSHVFDTGVHIELPHGYYGKIESKSGLNINHDIVSLGGVIDEGFTGSITVKLYNMGSKSYMFKKGDKIAQLVIQDYIAPKMEFVTELEKTDRGDDGFGSTGR